MKRTVIAAIAILALGTFAGTAPAADFTGPVGVPASPSEALVYKHAAWQLRSIGVRVPNFDVSVGTCGPGYACSLPGHVFLSKDAASEARRYARAAGKRLRVNRLHALVACDRVCLDSAQAALHELIHIARYPGDTNTGSSPSDVRYEEGLAEAVAVDQVGPMMYRVSGWRNAASDGYVYADWVESVQAATGGLGYTGRRNRLNAVASPNRLSIAGPDESFVF